MSLKLFVLSGLLAFSDFVHAASEGTEVAAESPISGTDTVHGCYSYVDNLTFNSTNEFNSQGSCTKACRAIGLYVGASNAKDCYCGDEYPPLNTLTDDTDCTEPCPGYGTEACGGINTYTVYNTGVRVSVANAANISDTSSSSTSATAASTTQATIATSAGIVVTVTPTTTASSDNSGSGSKTIGIAVGVVVGVIALAAIAGAAIFVTRRRRNREIEEEHRRNAAVNAFISGGKPPSSSGGLSISDQRLDPVMAQRRMSSGSIADEADYSRRILRVTNA